MATTADPAWASKLTEPTEVVGSFTMRGSWITHLSPLLHFNRGDGFGISFSQCKHLKVAEGNFDTIVEFETCGIEEIGNLQITPDPGGHCATFYKCPKLRAAKGTFAGFVNFTLCGIKEADELNITAPNISGFYALLADCPLSQKDPMLAAKLLTQSEDLETWVKMEAKAKTAFNPDLHAILEAGIHRLKRKRLAETLRLGENGPTI
jgi:hypothetical protein